MKKLKVGIIGGTGYTGVELLRLLVMHPAVELCVITSRSEHGREVADLFPSLRGHCTLEFTDPDSSDLDSCDLVFSATPNGIAMQHAKHLMSAGVRLIDLAADFRLKDPEVYQQWYGIDHACPELLANSVYGLPEINREQIKEATIVANPGCYPTAVTLGFLPLVHAGLVDHQALIADAKSGVTGAGRGASVATLYSEVSDSFKAYAAAGHRHHPEISQTLSAVAEQPVGLTFIPHLVPMLRGIHATLYADLKIDLELEEVHNSFKSFYQNEPFVDILPMGSHPETRSVKSSNVCRIAIHKACGSNKIVVLAVIDNLTKGAAGQAVQNMNIMFNINETTGLEGAALLP